MSLVDLYQDVIDRRQERIRAADHRLFGLMLEYKAYTTLGLRCHFTNVVERCLRARDDGSLLDCAIDEIERFLVTHKRRCDETEKTHASAS